MSSEEFKAAGEHFRGFFEILKNRHILASKEEKICGLEPQKLKIWVDIGNACGYKSATYLCFSGKDDVGDSKIDLIKNKLPIFSILWKGVRIMFDSWEHVALVNSNIESEVRYYCKLFPVTFAKGEGSYLWDSDGNRYLDFLAGCGSLNYGHHPSELKSALLTYIEDNGIVMSMDMRTQAKAWFIQQFSDKILLPRHLDYKLQFPGPTGANAVEAAIKLARKITGRQNIIAFTNAFHGCSLGALSLTGNSHHRSSSQSLLTHVTRIPYDGYFGAGVDTADMLDRMLEDPSSGIERPAAIIFEPIQGEGGLNNCSPKWAQAIAKIAKKHGASLIVDEIQSGCGRSGNFFAFESLKIQPDIICMAKAISGYGLPMSLVLIKPELDIWESGEHNGTFRGNNLAFVTAAKAIQYFWSDDIFQRAMQRKIAAISTFLSELHENYPQEVRVKGRGMMLGLEFIDPQMARAVRKACFDRGLIVELCGSYDEVLKLLPPLNISEDVLLSGLDILKKAVGSKLSCANSILMRAENG